MALTITQYPLSKTPAYNDQWFIGSSNQTAISDFYYKIDFTCNSVTLTEKVLPDLNGRFVYNAKEKAKNFIEHYFNPNDTGFPTAVEAVNKAVSVTLTVTEYYSGALQTAGAYTMSYTAFDACLNEVEFADYVPTFFCNTILGSDKQLNLADNVVTPFTDIWVHSFKAYEIKITVNATLLTTFNIVDVNKIYVYNFGYKGLLALGHTLAVGDVVTIDVRTTIASLTTYTYTVQDICSRFDVTRLYYLSRSGRILYKQFSLAATKRMSKKTSNVRLGKGNVVSGIITTNRWDREVHEVANVTTYTSTLTSDWITESQNEALQELFDSPIVWQHDGTNYIPVTITDTSYDFKKHNSDKLFNYTVNIEYNTQETRQRGL
jgi:hypothetical protein